MRNETSRISSLLVLCFALACGDATDDEAAGELRVGLWGNDENGVTYSLRSALFDISGSVFATDNLPDGTASLSVEYPAGSYVVTLIDGWQVMRGDVDDHDAVQVEADLVSPNPLLVTIEDNLVTSVDYVFEIEGELVPMHYGSVDIDVDFEPDDGVCQPLEPQLPLYVMAGSGVGAGEGWQSFTLNADERIVQLSIGVTDAPGNGFIIEIHEGVGPDGPLLDTVIFPNFPATPAGTSLWLVSPVADVDLEAGTPYTLVGVGVDGWELATGALPAATSSEGNNAHRNFILAGMYCD